MFDSYKEKRRLRRLRSLERGQVVFDGEKITIKTTNEEIVLKAVIDLVGKSVTISGDGIITDNQIVRAIWVALWEEKVAEESLLCFGDCEVIAEPNFIKITKKEVIVIDD